MAPNTHDNRVAKMLNALVVAREFISTDRNNFADCAMTHDGVFEACDAEELADFDAALLTINSAIQSATAPAPDEPNGPAAGFTLPPLDPKRFGYVTDDRNLRWDFPLDLLAFALIEPGTKVSFGECHFLLQLHELKLRKLCMADDEKKAKDKAQEAST